MMGVGSCTPGPDLRSNGMKGSTGGPVPSLVFYTRSLCFIISALASVAQKPSSHSDSIIPSAIGRSRSI